MGAKKILLVDDDKTFVASTRDLLEAEGYEVAVAYDGASGLEAARRAPPDMMILDVMMASDTEGFEVSRKIAKFPELKDVAVIIMSGIRKAKKLTFGFEPDQTWLPVKAVLEKPVPPKKFLQIVKSFL